MHIAIIILNWNGEQLLEEFLPSIVNFSDLNNVEIVVADNSSTDNSIHFIKKNYPQVTIVKNEVNGGFAKGYNDALQHIKADIFALVNSDIEVTENWLQPILTIFETEPDTAVIQPKILDYKNKELFEYAGAGGGYIDKFGYPYCRGRIFSEIEKDLQQYDDIAEIFWASGACFFIRSSVYHQLNGFDEDFFAHQEEIDLCWRVHNLQKSIKYVGYSTVYHVGGATLKESNPRKTFLNFRNSLYTLTKNLPRRKLFLIILTRLILDGVAGIKFLIELRPIHTLAIIKAHFSFFSNLNKMLKKRRIAVYSNNYYSISSIVWNYFILGKKKIDQLIK